jgi:hypothetical protein
MGQFVTLNGSRERGRRGGLRVVTGLLPPGSRR